MDWTQVFLAVMLTVTIGAFAAIMIALRRSTGTSPVGHTGGHRLAAALNKTATLLFLVTAIAACLDTRSVAWFGHLAALDHPIAQGVGVVTSLLAGVCIIWGEISLGRSFRVALPESKQPLVTRGLYRFIRNPLALSVNLLALGVLLLAPSWLALVSLALAALFVRLLENVIAYEWKIRIEEAYLREAHGEAYSAYCARTGRYLPRFFQGRWGEREGRK